MKTSDYIRLKIDRLPKGYIFTYIDFITEVNNREAVIKSLNRLAASGKLNKLSKGKYYKPETTVFGSLLPDQFQVVKDLLEKDEKLIGYITGYGIYNQLGLTTQVSNIIQIGRKDPRPVLKRGIYKISFIKQKNIISKENIPLLQLLDTIRFIKKIPDTSVQKSIKTLSGHLKKLGVNETETLIKLTLKYPPATRALLGALLEHINVNIESSILKKRLNPITKYKLFLTDYDLPTAKNWNIL